MAGQYFTTNPELIAAVHSLILNKPKLILEPSVGRGDLIFRVKDKYHFDLYEIDSKLAPLPGLLRENSPFPEINYTDFLTAPVTTRYKTIIGNPPFVRTKTGNLYLEFVEKCAGLLEANGELIFIVPSDFFKLTSASKILSDLVSTGSFTHVIHPHNDRLFNEATIDVLAFRYQRGHFTSVVNYNSINKHLLNTEGTITFHSVAPRGKYIKELFDIYVGMVSGKENVFKSELGNRKFLVGEDRYEKYIFLYEFPSSDPMINSHLEKRKQELLDRKINKFTESNWWKWGAERNIKVMQEKAGQDCIFVYNVTRRENVAFQGKVGYFSGNLLMLVPKADMNLDFSLILEEINTGELRENYTFSKRFKIGHRQLSNYQLE